MIATVLTLTDTYSFFQKDDGGQGSVIAANREDIISSMEIYYDKDVPILKLERGKNIEYSPIVFFSIEGDAKDYTLHVNSVKLDGTVEIPIIPNVNFPQALSLILSPRNEVTGIMNVKHLNEFIDETLEFSFSKEYLLARYFYDRGIERYNVSYLSISEKDELVDLVGNTLLYAKRYLGWDAVEWEEEDNWISEMHITADQVLLVDIIAPGLMEYNERLYQLFEIITRDLENQIEKNNILLKENEALLETIEELEGENGKLHNHINALELEIEELLDRLGKETVPEEPETIEVPEEPEVLENPDIPDELN